MINQVDELGPQR